MERPTTGAIARIMSGASLPDFHPLVELRDLRALGEARYKAKVADGEYITQAVIMPTGEQRSNLLALVEQNALQIHSLIRLTEYRVEELNTKTFFFILEGDLLGLIPEAQRVPAERLQSYKASRQPGAVADSQVGLSQVDPQMMLGRERVGTALTTPEKRFGMGPGEQQMQTPPPAAAPQSAAFQGMQQQGAPPPWAKPMGATTGAEAASSASAANPYASLYGGTAPGSSIGRQVAPNAMSSGAVTMGAAAVQTSLPSRTIATQGVQSFHPIRELSPYTGGKWKIKARVLTKSDIRKFTNARGEGQFFKVDLADASGEISGTFFGRAVDQWYEKLRQGQVFSFSKGSIKAANKRFDRGDHVITFEESSVIEGPIAEDQGIPGVTYDFKQLAEVAALEPNVTLDVAAVIFAVGDPLTFTARTSQREMTKRELGLWDGSGPDGSGSADLTLWGERALGTSFEVGSVIFMKGARVTEWNGAKGLASPTCFEINPDDPRAFTLNARFEEHRRTRPGAMPTLRSGGGAQPAAGTRKTLEACREEDLQLGPPLAPGQPFSNDKDAPRTVHSHFALATLCQTSIGDRMPCYPSCPELVDSMRTGATQGAAGDTKRSCNKKTTREGQDGPWRCMNGHVCQQPVWRYICRMQVMDHTSDMEINLFDETAKKLFGCEASEYARLFEENAHDAVNQRAMWKRVSMKLKSKKEHWQETERVRTTLEGVSSVDYAKEGRHMLSEVLASLNQAGQSTGGPAV